MQTHADSSEKHTQQWCFVFYMWENECLVILVVSIRPVTVACRTRRQPHSPQFIYNGRATENNCTSVLDFWAVPSLHNAVISPYYTPHLDTYLDFAGLCLLNGWKVTSGLKWQKTPISWAESQMDSGIIAATCGNQVWIKKGNKAVLYQSHCSKYFGLYVLELFLYDALRCMKRCTVFDTSYFYRYSINRRRTDNGTNDDTVLARI